MPIRKVSLPRTTERPAREREDVLDVPAGQRLKATNVSPWYGVYKLSFTLKASFATETATIKIMR
jgi:hypothetical protein